MWPTGRSARPAGEEFLATACQMCVATAAPGSFGSLTPSPMAQPLASVVDHLACRLFTVQDSSLHYGTQPLREDLALVWRGQVLEHLAILVHPTRMPCQRRRCDQLLWHRSGRCMNSSSRGDASWQVTPPAPGLPSTV